MTYVKDSNSSIVLFYDMVGNFDGVGYAIDFSSNNSPWVNNLQFDPTTNTIPWNNPITDQYEQAAKTAWDSYLTTHTFDVIKAPRRDLAQSRWDFFFPLFYVDPGYERVTTEAASNVLTIARLEMWALSYDMVFSALGAVSSNPDIAWPFDYSNNKNLDKYSSLWNSLIDALTNKPTVAEIAQWNTYANNCYMRFNFNSDGKMSLLYP